MAAAGEAIWQAGAVARETVVVAAAEKGVEGAVETGVGAVGTCAEEEEEEVVTVVVAVVAISWKAAG